MLDLSSHATDTLAQALNGAGFRGEIEADTALRAAMSTDNSVYQILPDLIVAPRDAADMVRLLEVLERPEFSAIALTARGGGTGTNGQSLNRGVIVDLRRHMNRLLALDTEAGWAEVEPGMVLDDLNAQIRPSGWFFAPETSTSTRCTIGGMVSTDASGKGSRIYGKTSDNILGLELAQPQGLLSSLAPAPDWARPMLARAEAAAKAGRAAFIANTPKLNRRFTGYDLERACPPEGGFEWWRLFLGAEGTLGLISRVRVKLRRIEPEKRLLIVGFDSFRNALAAATPLLAANPTAVEVMDETVQAIADRAGILARLPEGLRARPDQRVAYVFIEINGADPTTLDAAIAHCREIVAGLAGAGASHMARTPEEIRELWAIRSAGVGLLGKVDGAARPIAFVEDTVVPPEHLPAFLDEFLALLSANGLGYGIYGHVDVGCLHIRPALDVDSQTDRAKLQTVSDGVFALTQKYGGIFWGEHGKGVRGAYLRGWIGEEAYRELQGVKAAFDPRERFNPGKLVSNGTPIMEITGTPFRKANAPEGDALTKAFRCNGNAQCLSYSASAPMCPSFKASADLRQSPKGRADALRSWHGARRANAPDLARQEADLLGALDSCLGCKACASSCPVQVDIPTMRAAFYADYYTRHKRPLAERITLATERHAGRLARFAPALRPFWPVLSRFGARLTQAQDMPARLARPPRSLRARDLGAPLPENAVIVVQDWFTALFDEAVQRDVLAGLEALGFAPRLLEMRPSGKAAQNAGDQAGFHAQAKALAELLGAAAATGAPLVAFEPAFGMFLRQDFPKAGIALPEVLMVQEFLQRNLARITQPPLPRDQTPATLLGHCTETTARPSANAEWSAVFAAIGVALDTPATGCCGMAGLYGHQRRHQTSSKRLFDLSWKAHMGKEGAVMATGFSCRCQSARFSGAQLRHPLGIIAERLAQTARA